MTRAIAMSGADTIIINNTVLTGLATGTCATLKFPNEIANLKTGKNGNSIYGHNATGKQAELELHLLRACSDDKFLNNLYAQQELNFAGTVLLTGQLIKKIGDGSGNIASDTYILSGGVFVKPIEAQLNVEGTPEQSIAVYTMRFSYSPRTLT